MIEKTSTSTQGNDVANEGLIICPFCANEIREKSIRCQYCGEYLAKKKFNVKENDGNGGSKIVWFIILLFIFIICKSLISSLTSNGENVRSYAEIREDLSSAKTDSVEMQNLLNDTIEVMDKFYTSVQSIDSGSLYLDASDYKNKNLLKKSIDSRNHFDSSVKEYSNDVEVLFTDHNFLDDAGNSKYSLSGLLSEIKNFSNSLTSYKNKVVDFYGYILSIQDSFYVENDGSIYFYSKGTKMDKFNQLSSEVYNASIKFNEVYSDYMNYMSNYTKYRNIK